MKNVFAIISILMLTIFSSIGQNSVVDKFTDSKHAHIVLYPNESIKENYAKIQSLMELHEERKYAEYTIVVQGYYTSEKGKYLDENVGHIHIKGEDNERFYTVSKEIIEALTQIYARSLDEPFNCKSSDYFSSQVTDYKNVLYRLKITSSLYKKIYHEVIKETGLTVYQDETELIRVETKIDCWECLDFVDVGWINIKYFNSCADESNNKNTCSVVFDLKTRFLEEDFDVNWDKHLKENHYNTCDSAKYALLKKRISERLHNALKKANVR